MDMKKREIACAGLQAPHCSLPWMDGALLLRSFRLTTYSKPCAPYHVVVDETARNDDR